MLRVQSGRLGAATWQQAGACLDNSILDQSVTIYTKSSTCRVDRRDQLSTLLTPNQPTESLQHREGLRCPASGAHCSISQTAYTNCK